MCLKTGPTAGAVASGVWVRRRARRQAADQPRWPRRHCDAVGEPPVLSPSLRASVHPGDHTAGGSIGPRGATAPCSSVRPPTFPSVATARQSVPQGTLSKLKPRLWLAEPGSHDRHGCEGACEGPSSGFSPGEAALREGGLGVTTGPLGSPLCGPRALRLQNPSRLLTSHCHPAGRLDWLEGAH